MACHNIIQGNAVTGIIEPNQPELEVGDAKRMQGPGGRELAI
jgi:hypothetical protein